MVFTPDFATAIFALPAGLFGVIDVKARTIDRGGLGVKEIHALDIDSTARIAAMATADDSIRVIDREKKSTLAIHRGHIGPARRVVFRADARKLASAGDDGKVRIWNVPDPNEPIPFSKHHEHNVTALAFAQDGARLATGDYLGSIAVWNSRTGNRVQILGSHYLRRKSQPIPLEIGTGKPMEKGTTKLKHHTQFTASDTPPDPIIDVFTSLGHGGEVKGVAFTQDKNVLVSVGAQKLIIWDLKSGEPLKECEHPTMVSSLAMSPDGAFAATGCWDDIVRIFRVPSGELVKELDGHRDDVMCVAFHPSGKELASGGRDRTTIVFDVATGKVKHRLGEHTNTVSVVGYSPDGKRLITGGMDKAIHVWNAETGDFESTLHGHTDDVTSLAFSTDGQWLVTASDGDNDTSARVWLSNSSRFREGARGRRRARST